MRITLATIKSFIKKNRANLYINQKSRFDEMIDCVTSTGNDDFELAQVPDVRSNHKECLGIKGAWFVFNSRDYFKKYEDNKFTGFEVSNCCGSFILAIPK